MFDIDREIEYRKPKKVFKETLINDGYEYEFNLCPHCGSALEKIAFYCDCCGGKLDWSEILNVG